jgi:hypothetical protein
MLRRPEIFVSLVVCLFIAPQLTSAQQITLAQELANNTSACTIDSQHPYCTTAFAGFEDQNDVNMGGDPIETIYPDPAPGHVTSVSLPSTVAPTLMYSGFNGQFLCNYMPWFGSSSHKNVGYNETNSQTTNAQAAAMNAAGCNVAPVSFYGTVQLQSDPDFAFDLQATGTLFASVGGASGLRFGIMEIDQAFSGTDTTQDPTGNCNRFASNDPTDTINCIEGALDADFNYINTNYVSVGDYYWTNGSPTAEPVIAFFGSVCDFAALSFGDPTEDCKTLGPGPNAIANWNTIWSAVQNTFPGLKVVFQYGAFGRPMTSSGEFAWPQPSVWDKQNGNVKNGSQYWWCDPNQAGCNSTTYLYNFYEDGSQNPQDLTVGLLDKGFDDTNASWGKNRVTSQECGNVLLLTAQQVSANGFFGAGNQIPYMQIATWNDYEEGTEIETGIDNCYSVSGSIGSGMLNWTLASSDLYGFGTTSTIHHFTIWWGLQGDDPNKLIHVAATNVAGNQTSISLSDLTVPTPAPGYTVDLYVEAVGMPLFLNKMSAAIPYTPPPQ